MSHAQIEPISAKGGERSGWEVLSLLRFCLALIVACDHLNYYSENHRIVFHWLGHLGAFEAILGFLLISGYSIGSSIQKESAGFFRRRMLRIYPVYLAAMLITWLVEREPVNGSLFLTILFNLFFMGQLLVGSCYVKVAWSLCLEVWLYCLAPVFKKLRASSLEWLCLGSFVVYAIYTCGRSLIHLPYYTGTIGGVNLPCLAFIWVAGFYLSVSPVDKKRPLYLIGALFAGHFLLTVAIQFFHRCKTHALHAFFSHDLANLLAPGVLLLIVLAVFVGIRSHVFQLSYPVRRMFRFCGDLSYPFYLVHLPVFMALTSYTKNALLLLPAALLVAATVFFACDFYSRRRKIS